MQVTHPDQQHRPPHVLSDGHGGRERSEAVSETILRIDDHVARATASQVAERRLPARCNRARHERWEGELFVRLVTAWRTHGSHHVDHSHVGEPHVHDLHEAEDGKQQQQDRREAGP